MKNCIINNLVSSKQSQTIQENKEKRIKENSNLCVGKPIIGKSIFFNFKVLRSCFQQHKAPAPQLSKFWWENNILDLWLLV